MNSLWNLSKYGFRALYAVALCPSLAMIPEDFIYSRVSPTGLSSNLSVLVVAYRLVNWEKIELLSIKIEILLFVLGYKLQSTLSNVVGSDIVPRFDFKPIRSK